MKLIQLHTRVFLKSVLHKILAENQFRVYVPDPSQSLKLYCCSKMLLGRPSGWQQETTCVSHEFHPINFWRGLSPKGHLVYHAQQRSIQIWQTKKLRTTVSTQWWYADAEMKKKPLRALENHDNTKIKKEIINKLLEIYIEIR